MTDRTPSAATRVAVSSDGGDIPVLAHVIHLSSSSFVQLASRTGHQILGQLTPKVLCPGTYSCEKSVTCDIDISQHSFQLIATFQRLNKDWTGEVAGVRSSLDYVLWEGK